jgi:hypothetical protein
MNWFMSTFFLSMALEKLGAGLLRLACFVFFACLRVLFFGEAVAVVTPWGLAGGGPAAAHFSCLAKKSKQKKASPSRCPCGVPEKADGKPGSAKTRLRLRHLRFFIRLAVRFFGSVQGGTASPHLHPDPPLEGEGCSGLATAIYKES